MLFQIRAKVSRDPIENGPVNSAVYESEQVSFLFFFFFFIKFVMEKCAIEPFLSLRLYIYIYMSTFFKNYKRLIFRLNRLKIFVSYNILFSSTNFTQHRSRVSIKNEICLFISFRNSQRINIRFIFPIYNLTT